MSQSRPPQVGRSVAVALFERDAQARSAVQLLRDRGFDDAAIGLFVPSPSGPSSPAPPLEVTGLLAAAPGSLEVRSVLVSMGVPEGEARFYEQEVQNGRSLVVVRAPSGYDAVRSALLGNGGYDVESLGASLVRSGSDGAHPSDGVAPRPMDVTDDWTDVRSRYEMLWQQHYGTTDATWTQMEPLYRFAWQLANDPAYRGRPWAAVEADVRRDFERAPGSAGLLAFSWPDAAGPIQDVWQDVADEARTRAEGGADRRIPSQGTDQSVPARDLSPPRSAS